MNKPSESPKNRVKTSAPKKRASSPKKETAAIGQRAASQNKKASAPKKSAAPQKNGTASQKRATATQNRSSAPQKKSTPPPEKGRLSFVTVFLLVLSIAVVLFLVFFCINRFAPKSPSGSEPTAPSESIDGDASFSPTPSATPSASDTAPISPTPSDKVDPTETPSLTPTPTPTPSTDPTPTPSVPSDVVDTARVFFKRNEQKTVTVQPSSGKALIHYTAPDLSVPYSQAVEDRVNAEMDAVIRSVCTALEKNINRNYIPYIHGECYEVTVTASLFRSPNSFTVLLEYQTIAGNTDFIEEVTTATFDAATGKRLTVEDVVTDQNAMIAHLELLLSAEENCDTGYLRGTLCNGFYFDGSKMVLLYNGTTIFPASPFRTTLTISDQRLFTGN